MWFLPGIGGILWKNPSGQYANIASDTFIKTDDPKENNPVVRQESHRGEPSYSDLLNRTTRQHTFLARSLLDALVGPIQVTNLEVFHLSYGQMFRSVAGSYQFYLGRFHFSLSLNYLVLLHLRSASFKNCMSRIFTKRYST